MVSLKYSLAAVLLSLKVGVKILLSTEKGSGHSEIALGYRKGKGGPYLHHNYI